MKDDDKSVRDGAMRNVAEGSGEEYNAGVVVAPALSFAGNGNNPGVAEGGVGMGQNKKDQYDRQQEMFAKMSRQGLNEIGRTGFGVMNRKVARV